MNITQYIPKNKKDLENKRSILARLIKLARHGEKGYILEHLRFLAKEYCYKKILIKLARQKKVKSLYKNLAEKLLAREIKDLKNYNIPVKIRISTTTKSKTYVKFNYYSYPYKVTDLSFNINIPQIKRIYKRGFKDYQEYYKGRTEKLNSVCLHNRKRTLKFALLHEISHIKFAFHNKLQKNSLHIKNEFLADKIAIKRLDLECIK